MKGINEERPDRAVDGPFLFATLPVAMIDVLEDVKPIVLLETEVCQAGRVGDALEVGL